MRIAGGDMPQQFASYPEHMNDVATAWRTFDTYEYSESQGMPVPIKPLDPYTAAIVMSSGISPTRVIVIFSYKDGRLGAVSERSISVRRGKL